MFHYFQVFKKICLGEEFHDLIKKICCLTVPRIFVGESFCVSKNFGYRKFSRIRGGGGGGEGGVSRFSVKSFLSHITKTFRGTIQCFMIFGYQKKLIPKK